MPRRRKLTEHELLQSLAGLAGASKAPRRGRVIGAGDDGAVLRPEPGRDWIVTTDCLVEGRHFRRAWLSGYEIGWRLAAVNLSDIAAMGGRPSFALLSFMLPRDVDSSTVHAIQRGARDHLARYGASIVGGNISGIERDLVCDLALLGTCRRGRAWTRRGRAGRDAIVVVGHLGSARAGRELLDGGGKPRYPSLVEAFKRPLPLLELVPALRREPGLAGAIDVSDGFSADLIHMCEASGRHGVGAEIEATALPISRALAAHCRHSPHAAIEYALNGGEDYAMILSIASERAETVARRIERRLGVPARVVGRFTRRPGEYVLRDAAGRWRPLPRGGWDHLGSSGR